MRCQGSHQSAEIGTLRTPTCTRHHVVMGGSARGQPRLHLGGALVAAEAGVTALWLGLGICRIFNQEALQPPREPAHQLLPPSPPSSCGTSEAGSLFLCPGASAHVGLPYPTFSSCHPAQPFSSGQLSSPSDALSEAHPGFLAPTCSLSLPGSQ